MSKLSDKVLKRILVILFILAIYFLVSAFYIPVKAVLAQRLLQSAWHNTQLTHGHNKAWPWADSWPVARMRIPELGIDQIILEGDQGSNLAFAPGRQIVTSIDKRSGLTMISAHRDTHFEFLREVALGQMVQIENELGDVDYYQIEDMQVINSDTNGIDMPQQGRWLVLVTCYPFDAINPGGPMRYVVFAEKVEQCADTPCLS